MFELGWSIWDPKEVYTEFPAVKSEDNTKVDIALFTRANLPSVYIEIKSHTKIEQNLPSIEKQLRDYNRNNTATFTIITDGQHWRFYYSQTQGEFSDKCYCTIDLLNDDYLQLEENFVNLLSKDRISNGQAKSVAEKFLELSTKERAIRNSLSEADKRMLANPLLNRVQAIQECLKEDGYNVTQDEILIFLGKSTERGIYPPIKPLKSIQPTITPPLPKTGNGRKSTSTLKVSINGHVFYKQKAIDVFIEVINFLGIERVKGSKAGSSKYPLVIDSGQYSTYKPHKYSSANNGYYILTHSSTQAKKQYLEDLAKSLSQRIDIEVIGKD